MVDDRRPTAATQIEGHDRQGISELGTLAGPWQPGHRVADVLRAGDVLGERYCLQKILGEGGMGVVWRADDRQLQRTVAIKMIRSRLSQDAALRLRREARTAAGLTHPNVVAVYDVGTHREMPYIVMQYVEGVDLKRWLAEHPDADVPTTLNLCIAAGRGLAAAHARGIVHRDFKPSNVLLDHNGEVRVADFGLARTPSGLSSDNEAPSSVPLGSNEMEATLTETGTILGTPAYMAPEQASGAPLTAAIDVYAFGLTLYEALYRRRPFQAKSIAGLQRLKLAGAPKSAPPRDVPPAVHEAIVRALEPSADNRWPDLDAMLRVLSRAVRPSRHIGRWVFAAALGGLGLWGLATIGGNHDDGCQQRSAAALQIWQSAPTPTTVAGQRRHQQARDFAEQWAQAHAQHCAADTLSLATSACLSEQLSIYRALLGHSDSSTARNWTMPTPQDCATAAVARRAPPPTNPRDAERATQLRLWAEPIIEAKPEIQPDPAIFAANIAEAETLGHAPTLARVLLAAARHENRAERITESLAYAQRAIDIASASGVDRDAVRGALVALEGARDQGNVDDAERWFGFVQSMAQRLPNGAPMHRDALATLGSAYFSQMRTDEAIDSWTTTLQMHEGAEETELATLTALNGLAAAHLVLDEFDVAASFGERALAVASRMGTANTYTVLGSRMNMGAANLMQGNYAAAEQIFAEISEQAASNEAIEPQLRWMAELNRALAIGKTSSRRQEALGVLDTLQREVGATAGVDSADYANIQVVRARLELAGGDSQAALATITEPLRQLERLVGEDHPHAQSARQVYERARRAAGEGPKHDKERP